MCGRFSLATSWDVLCERFDLPRDSLEWKPRYNLAPSQPALTILNDGTRHPELLTWGLVPHWAKDRKIGYKMMNARAETLSEKPAFKHSFKKRRCLVLADGFFEWRDKKPYRVVVDAEKPFAFAGLWDDWKSPQGDHLRTFTIITTDANKTLEPIHDRMPAILLPEDEEKWIDPKVENPHELLKSYPADQTHLYEVSSIVNSWKNDTPECLQRI